jgi:hypothetical protein
MATDLAPRDALWARLRTQRLVGAGLGTPTEVVRLLGCVQSQEWAHAFWSLGMRSEGVGCDAVRREFDGGAFVRTHILRPTWHFLAAEDLRWIQSLTAPRVQQLNRGRYRQLGLGPDELDRGAAAMLSAVSGGRFLTRPELRSVLEEAGIGCEGQRLAHLVMYAELELALCSGPLRGAQHTYAALDERVPAARPRSREEALAELVRRFFVGHGPAGIKDFTRWSSLTTADARLGLELAGDRLATVQVAGEPLWYAPAAAPSAPTYEPGPALLVPLYDEVTLSYPRLSFPVAAGHPHPPDGELFLGSVIHDATNVGTWRRTVKGSTVVLEPRLAPGLGARTAAAVDEAMQRLAGFLGLELLVFAEPALGGNRQVTV